MKIAMTCTALCGTRTPHNAGMIAAPWAKKRYAGFSSADSQADLNSTRVSASERRRR